MTEADRICAPAIRVGYDIESSLQKTFLLSITGNHYAEMIALCAAFQSMPISKTAAVALPDGAYHNVIRADRISRANPERDSTKFQLLNNERGIDCVAAAIK